jgi:GxxExxY protein
MSQISNNKPQISPARAAQPGRANQPSAVGGQPISILQSLISSLTWDEYGLLPTIVQDAETGEVLTLAYMNAESLGLTLETGQTWFWSRSRKELWHKGATSGNIQHVVEVRYDCDGDALLVRVKPAGPACHTGERTCFYRTLANTGSTDYTETTDDTANTDSAGYTETTDGALAAVQTQRAMETASGQARTSKKVKGPHEDITYKINGAAMAVHRRLGPGHKEEVYQRALELELAEAGLNFESQKNLPVYDGERLVGLYIPDFIVEGKVVVEIKAHKFLTEDHRAQVIAYLSQIGCPIGLLINFGGRSLKWSRIFPSPDVARHRINHQWLFVPDELK